MTRRAFNVAQPIVFRDGTMQYAFRNFVQAIDRVLVQAEATADGAVQSGGNVSALVNDAGYLTAYAPPAVRNEATTPYALVLADADAVLRFTAASPAVTIPAEATVAFPVGTELRIRQAGTGTLALTTTGLTINGTLPTWAQHVEVLLRKVGADEWDVV